MKKNVYSFDDEEIKNNILIPLEEPIHPLQPKLSMKQSRQLAYKSLILNNDNNNNNNENKNDFKKYIYQNSHQKLLQKNDVQKLSKMNLTNEKLNSIPYIGMNEPIETTNNTLLNNYNPKKDFTQNDVNNKKLDLINKFDQFYLNKFNQINDITSSNNIYSNFQDKSKYYQDKINNIIQEYDTEDNNKTNLKLLYILPGLNENNFSFCYHKTEKWFAYINKNLIIIENFSIECNRPQKILNESLYDLSSIKISNNNKILYASCNNVYPFILFFVYSPQYENSFNLINKVKFKHKEIIDMEISPKNNLAVVLTKINKENGTFVSILDFYHNEILITSPSNYNYNLIKWNKFLSNLEFTTIGETSITFWRINSSDGSLQYQDVNFDFNKNIDVKIKSIDFILSEKENTVFMILGNNKGEIYIYDTRTNSMIKKFENILINKEITNIISNKGYIAFIGENVIKYFQLNKDNNDNNLDDIFNYKNYVKLEFDSNIICLDCDPNIDEDLVLLTEKGIFHYLNLPTKSTVKLAQFYNKNKSKVLMVSIMKKYYDKFTIEKNPYENINENINENYIDNNENNLLNIRENYYLISAHDDGSIKIWSIPEYTLLYNYETINEKILTFDVSSDKILFGVSYSKNTVRLFNNEKLIGKFYSQHLNSLSPFKFIKFLPDYRYIYLIDNSNTMFLIYIENIEPLLIQYNMIMNIDYNIIDFNLSICECYNKFYMNIKNQFLFVYNRKFTNILKNENFENCIPKFYIQDKFNIIEYFKENGKILNKNKNQKLENYKISFSPIISEKSYIYLLSTLNKMLIIRNFELHTIENIIQFQEKILDFKLTLNFKFIIFIYEKKIQISQIKKIFNKNVYDKIVYDEYNNIKNIFADDLYENERELNNLLSNKKIIISDNSNLLIIYSNDDINIYKI